MSGSEHQPGMADLVGGLLQALELLATQLSAEIEEPTGRKRRCSACR